MLEIPTTKVLSINAPVAERVVKLARSGMRAYAHRLHKEQNGICPLCAKSIDLSIKGEGVLDHDHDTGRIRGLLHRSCNAAEGKISNAASRWGCKSSNYNDIVAYLQHLIVYLTTPTRPVIYPMHKTADEKADARKVAAKARRAELAARRAVAQQRRKNA